jgi:hypothetical protein
VSGPLSCQVIPTVARSPTVEANGVYCETKKVPEYAGFDDVTEPEVGVTTTVAFVPSSGYKIESSAPAAKSWWNSRVIEPDFSPAILVRHSEPNAVVSCSSISIGSSTEASDELTVPPLMVTL